MKIKENNRMVKFIMAAGSDFVQNEMSSNHAYALINNGIATHSDKFNGFHISVDGKFWLEGSFLDIPDPSPEKSKKKWED